MWTKHGDEWDDQASFRNQPYEKWKNSIVKKFILNNVGKNHTVLEIAPGHGRWTEIILKRSDNVILVDLNPKCIEFCKKKFGNLKNKNINYFANNGKDLSFIEDNSIDFIWSYDSFVHMKKDVIEAYLKEFSRILKNNGKAIIHHPGGRNNFFVKFKFLRNFGEFGKKIYNYATVKKYDNFGGWRADVSKEMIKKMAQNNLKIKYQINSWGKNNEFNIKLFNDYLTMFIK